MPEIQCSAVHVHCTMYEQRPRRVQLVVYIRWSMVDCRWSNVECQMLICLVWIWIWMQDGYAGAGHLAGDPRPAAVAHNTADHRTGGRIATSPRPHVPHSTIPSKHFSLIFYLFYVYFTISIFIFISIYILSVVTICISFCFKVVLSNPSDIKYIN